ncbi:hypothetical protein F511_43297 [Dorcoceras hygrometricum]|uniref:Trichome birefringence-like N-terminal domain-containing protein n=1 Tax=Dorcoceras hygrometricum TaxID=472368 RepID=A0A2Z7BSW6_9LAMI|nr:hypothetical protein F511_43297 [Dorcoceras hygrometricum]
MWVRDESYPLYNPGSCSLIDEQFDCVGNGRPDTAYHKLKWKPKNCTLPRFSLQSSAVIFFNVICRLRYID